jgi:Protein of unknown function (DUF2380)
MSRVNIRHKAKRYLCADLSHCNRVSLLSLVAVLTALTPALFASAETPAPIKIAIFDFELEDYSAGAALIGETPDDAAQLKRVTNEARQLIAQSGRYSLIDTSGADAEPLKARSLRTCGGCEADIALKLGADQSFIGIIARSSRTEYAVGFQIRDARNGAMIFKQQTELRMGTNDSWNRGAVRLIKNTLLDNQDQK